MPSVGLLPPPAGRCSVKLVHSQGIWMPSPSPKVSHRPQRPPLFSSAPLPSEVASATFPLPCFTSLLPGVSCSKPDTWQICCTWGRVVGGDYPSPGPIAFPAHSSAWSGPGVRSGSRPSPGIPPLGRLCRVMFAWRIPIRSWYRPRYMGGVPQVAPGHPHAGPACGRTRNLLPGPRCTWGSEPTGGSVCGSCVARLVMEHIQNRITSTHKLYSIKYLYDGYWFIVR